MLFPDYQETGVVYHVAPITDLGRILKEGIRYNDKSTYKVKYLKFHRFIDSLKPDNIPKWVNREKAVFASLNFSDNHYWHSHNVLLAVKIQPRKCWVANENLANLVYEPFILKDTEEFDCANHYIKSTARDILKRYWDTSLSFLDNLKFRKDKESGYDAEALVFHHIPPENIKLLFIISDHKIMSVEDWKKYFCFGRDNNENWQTVK